MTSPDIPTLALANGVTLPAIGYGVFQTAPVETVAAVTEALRVGYRHLDTAAAYGNEREVGEALRNWVSDGGERADVVVETKIWASDYGYDATLHGFEKSAAKLGLDQIDILILHQVAANYFDRTLEAYRALEQLLADGRVRAIGVSNFPISRLQQVMDVANVVPHLNQVELHPYHSQPALQAFHREHGILTQAWSPIGGITFYPGWGDDEPRSVLADPVIGEIAAAHEVSPAQVMLRWHLQQGRSAIPKSVRPERIRENLDLGGFVLSDDELARIDALDTGSPSGPEPEREFDDRAMFPIPEA